MNTEDMITFLLFTFDYTLEFCDVVVKFSKVQCHVLFQLLGQGIGMLFSTYMCEQCAKGDGGTEMRHKTFFTSVT